MQKIKTKHLDIISGTASFACAIHCALLPFIFAILPAIGLAWIGSSVFGIGMVVFTFIIGNIAIIQGMRMHKSCWPLVWFGFGIIALVCGELFFHELSCMKHEHFDHHYISAFGGCLIVVAHVFNRILCHKCCSCEHEENET